MPSNLRPTYGWDWVKMHDEAVDVETGLLVWRAGVPTGRMLWIQGSAPFTLPTTNTGLIEVDLMESLLVAKVAAVRLLESQPGSLHPSRSRQSAEAVSRLERDIEKLAVGHGDTAGAVSLGPGW